MNVGPFLGWGTSLDFRGILECQRDGEASKGCYVAMVREISDTYRPPIADATFAGEKLQAKPRYCAGKE